jgi:hypothetical protein
MTSPIETHELPRYDPPELVALCREDEDGGDELAGWVMVLPEAAVAYLPDPNGRGALLSEFSSMTSASRVLDYTGVYPVRIAPMMPGAPKTLSCTAWKPPAPPPPPGPDVGDSPSGSRAGVTSHE